MESLAFAAVMALGQFSPGPDMLLLTRTALAEGGRRGVRMALGIATGLGFHATLALAGSSWLLGRGGWPGIAMRVLAGLYLLYLARGVWPRPGAETGNSPDAGGAAASPFRRGLLCNLLNPKVALFLAVVVAPFLSSGRPPWWPWLLGVMIVLEGALLWSLWAWLLQRPACLALYRRHVDWVDRCFSVALAGLGLWLLFEALQMV